MKQMPHGGDLEAVGREFGFDPKGALDFSSNLNWFLKRDDSDFWHDAASAVRTYGEASAEGVSGRISDTFGYEREHILATAGGIEAIYLAAHIFQGKRVLIGQPGFADYQRAFSRSEVRFWDFDPSSEDLEWCEVVIFGNPNNPTGFRYAHEGLRRRWPGKTWLIDEAFIEFSKDPPTDPSDDVILFRSLTKSWCIPGLRLGFALTSNEQWLSKMAELQPPWSVSAIAQTWAKHSLNSEGKRAVDKAIGEQLVERDRIMQRLKRHGNLTVHMSDSNFFLLELNEGGAVNLRSQLAKEGLVVRECESFGGLPADRFLRLAVRLPAENDRLVELIERLMGN